MIRISKDVLRQLNAATGKLDTDSGKVFQGFVGRLETDDGLYHGDLHYAEAGEEPPKDTVSVKAILEPKPSVGKERPKDTVSAKATLKPKPSVGDTDTEE